MIKVNLFAHHCFFARVTYFAISVPSLRFTFRRDELLATCLAKNDEGKFCKSGKVHFNTTTCSILEAKNQINQSFYFQKSQGA